MSSAQELKALLAPLRVYDLDAPFNGAELNAMGASLDTAQAELTTTEREMIPLTAQSWGLEQMLRLLPHRPVTDDTRELGQALAALLRISGDSFTPESIRDTLTGCGAVCQVEEGEPGYVTVSFPGIPGIPAGFTQMKRIIEDILPAHVLAQYTFWYITWTELETKLPTWQTIEALELTWTRLETYVT